MISTGIRISAIQIAASGEYSDDVDVGKNWYVNALDARIILQAAADTITL